MTLPTTYAKIPDDPLWCMINRNRPVTITKALRVEIANDFTGGVVGKVMKEFKPGDKIWLLSDYGGWRSKEGEAIICYGDRTNIKQLPPFRMSYVHDYVDKKELMLAVMAL